MKRRNAIKTIAISAVAPHVLLNTGEKRRERILRGGTFTSDWQQWPDMRWVGPEFWGNRLQDWVLQKGKARCIVQGANRSLYSLTCSLSERKESFESSVSATFLSASSTAALSERAKATQPESAAPEPASASQVSEGRRSKQYVAFRIGAKGKFKDYRSAVVFGKGLDVGLNSDGELFIGDEHKKAIPAGQTGDSVRLMLKGRPSTENNYALELSAFRGKSGELLGTLRAGAISAESLTGNLALVAHSERKGTAITPSAEFDDWKISGPKINQHPERNFGPICFAQYTLHKNMLKLTAQLAPVEYVKDCLVKLELNKGAGWEIAQKGRIEPESRIVRFRLRNWKGESDVAYRLRLELPLAKGPKSYFYEGTIAQEPLDQTSLKAAVFSCNCDFGFPDGEVVENVARHRPQLALFLGDQFYESHGGFGIETAPIERATLDYLRKWYMFGWSYREIFRHIPAAIIPDDHDVYHGNVWGESGSRALTNEGWGAVAQDQGGYKMPPEWVNMIQRTQTSHLPDPYDPRPVKQGIDVYYTNWNYGGISFAILEDRKFKSAPKNVLPEEADVRNGFSRNPDFDLSRHYDIDAELLGERQMNFLEDWSKDWRGKVQMKAILSQTNFCTVATLPEGSLGDDVVPSLSIPEPGDYIEGDTPTQDMDSNGWPQKGRDAALKIIRKCYAFHIAGDQHIGSLVQYGIDDYADAGFAFAGPALNNIWPRRWWPSLSDGHQALEGQPRYTGNFQDGFGNKMTIYAVANPRKTYREPAIIYDRATGYGMVIFDKEKRNIRVECWPRYVNPETDPQGQYAGWPKTIRQEENYGRNTPFRLPELEIEGMDKPVVEVYHQESGELEYSIRINGNRFKPKVFRDGEYLVRIGDPDREYWKEIRLRPGSGAEKINLK